MPFRGLTHVDPEKHVLDGSSSPREGAAVFSKSTEIYLDREKQNALHFRLGKLWKCSQSVCCIANISFTPIAFMLIPEADCLRLLLTNSLAYASDRLLICKPSSERQNSVCNVCAFLLQLRLVAWHSGRTSVFGRRTFSVLRSTCSLRVTTYVGKPSAMGQPTRPTQPFIHSGSIDE